MAVLESTVCEKNWVFKQSAAQVKMWGQDRAEEHFTALKRFVNSWTIFLSDTSPLCNKYKTFQAANLFI